MQALHGRCSVARVLFQALPCCVTCEGEKGEEGRGKKGAGWGKRKSKGLIRCPPVWQVPVWLVPVGLVVRMR